VIQRRHARSAKVKRFLKYRRRLMYLSNLDALLITSLKLLVKETKFQELRPVISS